MAVDRVKKLQGKEVTEQSKEYLSDKKKADADILEKDALIQKYVTNPPEKPFAQTGSSGLSKGKIGLLIFVVLAFFVGTGYGVYVMSIPANNSSGSTIDVNASAFPTVNNTTANQTVNQTNTASTTTVVTTPTTTTTVTPITKKTTTTGGTTGNSTKQNNGTTG